MAIIPGVEKTNKEVAQMILDFVIEQFHTAPEVSQELLSRIQRAEDLLRQEVGKGVASQFYAQWVLINKKALKLHRGEFYRLLNSGKLGKATILEFNTSKTTALAVFRQNMRGL
jgi:hypothetical protein